MLDNEKRLSLSLFALPSLAEKIILVPYAENQLRRRCARSEISI